MKLSNQLPSLRRRPLQNAVVGRLKLSNAAPAADMEDRIRLRKAAAWQWFMHGAGVEVQAPAEASARRQLNMTRLGSQSRRQASRFANEAASERADVSAASCLPLDDYAELPSLADLAKSRKNVEGHEKEEHFSHSFRTEKLKASNDKQEEEELTHSFRTSREHGLHKEEEFSHSFRTQRQHPEKMEPLHDKQKRQLHFLGFQKLLRKLAMPGRNRRDSNRSAPAAPDEKEVQQHHYHHYIHHLHHHYHHGVAGSAFEEVEVIRESHDGYTAHQRRRRHSESGFCYHQPQFEHYQDYSEEQEEDDEDEYYKVKGDSHGFRSHSHSFSKEAPLKAFGGEVDTVVGQPLHRNPSLAFATRCNSERFISTPNVVKLSHVNQSFLGRAGSDRRHVAEGPYTFRESAN